MMKKAISLAISLVMMCGLTITANATPSVQVSAAPAVSTAITASGAVISAEDLTVTAVKDAAELPAAAAAELKQAHQEILRAATVQEFLSNAGLDQAMDAVLVTFQSAAGQAVSAEDLTVHSLFDVSASGAAQKELEKNGSVTITFSVPELQNGQFAVVLHMTQEGWEVVPSTTGHGTISATFTSLSPVVVLVEHARTASVGIVTSPKTGDLELEPVMVSGAVMSAAALAFCLKRRIAA